MRFNAPPGWPQPPAGWSPPPDWRPDPAWGPAPPGWQFWVETAATNGTRPAPASPRSPSSEPPADPPVAGSNVVGWLMVLVPLLTCGVGACLPPAYAGTQQRRDRRHARRMYLLAAGFAVLTLGAWTMFATAPEDVLGDRVGWRADVGVVLILFNYVASIGVAFLVRNARKRRSAADLPGVAEELARRRQREEYRALVESDPDLARSIGVGRPDLPRQFDDGGLLDLNGVPLERLGHLAVVSAEEAERIRAARQRLGRFGSLDEVAVYADLSESSTARLRETAVFL